MKTRDTLPAEIDGFRLEPTPETCACGGEVFVFDGEKVCLDCLEFLPLDCDDDTGD